MVIPIQILIYRHIYDDIFFSWTGQGLGLDSICLLNVIYSRARETILTFYTLCWVCVCVSFYLCMFMCLYYVHFSQLHNICICFNTNPHFQINTVCTCGIRCDTVQCVAMCCYFERAMQGKCMRCMCSSTYTCKRDRWGRGYG